MLGMELQFGRFLKNSHSNYLSKSAGAERDKRCIAASVRSGFISDEPHTGSPSVLRLDHRILYTIIDKRKVPPGEVAQCSYYICQAFRPHYLQNNILAASCGSLKAFIDQADAQRNKTISSSDADALAAAAVQIRAVIGCNP